MNNVIATTRQWCRANRPSLARYADTIMIASVLFLISYFIFGNQGFTTSVPGVVQHFRV